MRFPSPCIRKYVEYYITDADELEAFALWAFGEDFGDLEYGLDFLEHWNILHGKELKLKECGLPKDDIPKMVELWNNLRVNSKEM